MAEEEEEGIGNRVLYICLLAVALFILSIAGGMIPTCVRMKDKERFTSLGNMFSGGVFLGGGLLHLLPEAEEGLQDRFTFPVAYILCGTGFFFILFIEEGVVQVQEWVSRTSAAKEQQREEEAKRVDRRRQRLLHNDFTDSPLRNSDQSRRNYEFLKLYYSQRQNAQAVINNLAPRQSLVARDESCCCGLPHDDDDVDRSFSTPAMRCSIPDSPSGTGHHEHAHENAHAHCHGGHIHFLPNEKEKEKQNEEKEHEDHHRHSGGSHGHSHGDFSSTSSSRGAIILLLALSVHALLEGMAMGTQTELSGMIAIFIAIASHSPLASFALSVSITRAGGSFSMLVKLLVINSMANPLGAILGLIISISLSSNDTMELFEAICQGVVAGTFLFIALAEIIPKELAIERDKPQKLALMLLGFVIMTLLKVYLE